MFKAIETPHGKWRLTGDAGGDYGLFETIEEAHMGVRRILEHRTICFDENGNVK